MVKKMEITEMQSIPKVNMPPWDTLLADLARIIREDELYPEEMPLECFDIH